MPTQRLSMRRIKEVLRLKHVMSLPERVIASTVGISNGAVHSYLSRARAAGLSWPLPEGLGDDEIELLLFPAPKPASQSLLRPTPDWSYIDRELHKRNVTRRLLWEEYRTSCPDGFGYTWFCTTYEVWKGRAKPSMRQTHPAGECLVQAVPSCLSNSTSPGSPVCQTNPMPSHAGSAAGSAPIITSRSTGIGIPRRSS